MNYIRFLIIIIDIPATNVQAQTMFTSPPMNLREELPFDTEDSFMYGKQQDASADYISKSREDNQMWKLGISSTLQPSVILEKIYSVLIDLDMEWKVINEYHIQCRPKTYPPENPQKFTIQLFKVKNKNYLLDFKKLSGDTCAFFEACSQLRFRFKQITEN